MLCCRLLWGRVNAASRVHVFSILTVVIGSFRVQTQIQTPQKLSVQRFEGVSGYRLSESECKVLALGLTVNGSTYTEDSCRLHYDGSFQRFVLGFRVLHLACFWPGGSVAIMARGG